MDRLAPEDRAYFELQFDSMHQKIDLSLLPITEDVLEIKGIAKDHEGRIGTLEQFKEGHQQKHQAEANNAQANTATRRFYWEIVAGSGVFGLLFGAFGLLTKWVMKV